MAADYVAADAATAAVTAAIARNYTAAPSSPNDEGTLHRNPGKSDKASEIATFRQKETSQD